MKQCHFCMNNRMIDYKDVETLKKFLTSQARILSRIHSGLCAKHARRLALAVKHARFIGLLPFVSR